MKKLCIWDKHKKIYWKHVHVNLNIKLVNPLLNLWQVECKVEKLYLKLLDYHDWI